jgi:hypothetical protein
VTEAVTSEITFNTLMTKKKTDANKLNIENIISNIC